MNSVLNTNFNDLRIMRNFLETFESGDILIEKKLYLNSYELAHVRFSTERKRYTCFPNSMPNMSFFLYNKF